MTLTDWRPHVSETHNEQMTGHATTKNSADADITTRLRPIYTQTGLDALAGSRVLVFGLGGVGSSCVEALARSTVGELYLVDRDTVDRSNLNRQALAFEGTIGRDKTTVMREMVAQINPQCHMETLKTFIDRDNVSEVLAWAGAEVDEEGRVVGRGRIDYVVDAIDTVTGKIELVEQANKAGTPIISCMGAGNKMDPAAFEVADIYKTSVCPLARVMRRELKRRGVKQLKVVYSKEPPIAPLDDMSISCRTHCICPPGTARKCTQRRQVPGSNAFVPAAAGLILAGEVVKDLTAWERPL